MLVFKQRTGELLAILLDEELLTKVLTAAAGAVTAKCLVPKNIRCIGLVRAGIQARLQLEYLRGIVACIDILAWGLNQKELDIYKTDMEPLGFCIQTTQNTEDLTGMAYPDRQSGLRKVRFDISRLTHSSFLALAAALLIQRVAITAIIVTTTA